MRRSTFCRYLLAIAFVCACSDSGLALNPIQLARLSGSDTNSLDSLGHSASLFETTALVGAWGDFATENDSSTQQAGSAYIFEQNNSGGWVETAHLTSTNPHAFHNFGAAASIWGTTAVVSAIGEDDTATDSGAVYIFAKDAGGNWPLSARLTDGATEDFRRFGDSLSLYQNTLLIGNLRDRPVAVYQKNNQGQWNKAAEIADPPGNGPFGHAFGRSLALQGNRALIGANSAEHSSRSEPGAAFIFEETAPGNWSQKAKLIANDAQSFDHFGVSVSLWGNTALIGAPFDDVSSQDSGSAYIFRDDGAGHWAQFAKLTPHDPSGDQRFGGSVSLFGNFALVGAINDDQFGSNSGAAYLFQEDIATGWHEIAKFKGNDVNQNALFGNAVSLYDGVSLIGAENNSSLQFRSGAAYLFSIPEPSSLLSLLVASGLIAFGRACRRR